MHTDVRQRVITGTTEWALLPSITPLTVGHLMIVPLEHVRGTAQLPLEQRRAVFQAAAESAALLRSGEVAVFEHGVGVDLIGGCGVDHAHIHLVPADRAAIRGATDQIRRDYPRAADADVESFLDDTVPEDSYLWLGPLGGPVTAVRTHDIPSQYLRRTIAQRIGSAAFDWRSLTGWLDFETTLGAVTTT